MPDPVPALSERLRAIVQRKRAVRGPEPAFTGSCPIREHTGDGHYVGRCEFATYDGYCPRHGALADYPDNDDRAVAVADRRKR